MTSVAFDWASRNLTLPASSPGLAVDPPEEGGFGIGHKVVMAKNEGDRASLKRKVHNFSENNRNQRRRKVAVTKRKYPLREHPQAGVRRAMRLCAPPSSDPPQGAKITWRRFPLRTLARIEQDRQAYSLTFAPASLPAAQTAISNHH